MKQILGPNTKVTVNGTDVSQFVTNVGLDDTADDVDVTGFGETYREFLPGLKNATITLSVLQGYGASEPDSVLGGMYYGNAAGTVKITPDTSGTVVYTMVSRIYGWSPVNGGVGDANSIDVTLHNAGTAGLTRGTA